jgi:hypothetical protein
VQPPAFTAGQDHAEDVGAGLHFLEG